MSTLTHNDLTSLFHQHAAALRRFLLWKVKSSDTAADLTQEAFLHLAQREKTKEIHDLRAFLYRTAVNLATDYLRKERRRQTTSSDLAEFTALPDEAQRLEEATAAKQKLAVLRQALAELSPLCQRIFELNRFQGLTHAQVARQLNIAESTVQKNLSRALLHVMQRLKGA
jgi:RNA polymerase sigma factor (sigma-70 family)